MNKSEDHHKGVIHHYNGMKHFIDSNSKHVLQVFLGIGLMIFVLNIAAMLSYLPSRYSHLAFNVSSFGSILIILISTYYLTESSLN